jgi:Ferric iron reductase FhuF-like transporter
MTRQHVLSALEVSRTYENAIVAGRMPPSFYIYREHSGLHFPDGTRLKDWGYVERDIAPYPRGTFIEVPCFSLISTPPGGSRPLLAELLDATATLRTTDGFFDCCVRPLLDLYFSSVVMLGLQPEAHAQNVVCLLNNAYMPVGFALRDMESVDKDVPILQNHGLLSAFTPTAYKFLSKDAYNYHIMHSFMYDFKFGHYLLGPLIDTWGAYNQSMNVTDVEKHTKAYVRAQMAALPDDFFPAGVWYDYEAIVHEGSPTREYRQHPNPRFR